MLIRLFNIDNVPLANRKRYNLIPFEALVDENNQYLVENYHITYLTSGRDLLRLKDKFASQQSPLIVADPFYGKAGEKVALTRSIDLSEFTFSGLPGTEQEATAIKNLWLFGTWYGSIWGHKSTKSLSGKRFN